MLLEINYRFESFLEGLNKNFVVVRPPVTSNLKLIYKRFMHENSTAEEFNALEKISIIMDNILKNAQNGWVSKSEIELNELKSSYAQYKFSELILTFLQAQDWPLQAFIEYQKKQFLAAEFSLEKGIQADWLLENSYHFKEMIFHRIHLIHNQAKVLLKNNDVSGAIKKILKMMRQIADPSNNLFSPPIQIESSPLSDEYISLLFYHLCDSLAIILKDNSETLLKLVGQEKLSLVNNDNICTIALNHIFSFIENRNFNNKSIDQILKMGNLHCAGFWYSAIAILHKHCEENGSPFANIIIQKLSHKNAPAFWIQFVKIS